MANHEDVKDEDNNAAAYCLRKLCMKDFLPTRALLLSPQYIIMHHLSSYLLVIDCFINQPREIHHQIPIISNSRLLTFIRNSPQQRSEILINPLPISAPILMLTTLCASRASCWYRLVQQECDSQSALDSFILFL